MLSSTKRSYMINTANLILFFICFCFCFLFVFVFVLFCFAFVLFCFVVLVINIVSACCVTNSYNNRLNSFCLLVLKKKKVYNKIPFGLSYLSPTALICFAFATLTCFGLFCTFPRFLAAVFSSFLSPS